MKMLEGRDLNFDAVVAPFLFSKLKFLFKRRGSDTKDEIKQKFLEELQMIPEDKFSTCFQRWKSRWKKCVTGQEEDETEQVVMFPNEFPKKNQSLNFLIRLRVRSW